MNLKNPAEVEAAITRVEAARKAVLESVAAVAEKALVSIREGAEAFAALAPLRGADLIASAAAVFVREITLRENQEWRGRLELWHKGTAVVTFVCDESPFSMPAAAVLPKGRHRVVLIIQPIK